jgi:hypothetical protein
MSISMYLDRLSEAAEILDVDLDKATFDLHLKVEGFQARTRLGQSVRVDSSSTYRELFVDPYIEQISIENGSRINFYLRFLRSSDHEMEATETDIYTGRFKQSGIGREPMMDLSFTDPDSDGDGLTNVEETILGLDFQFQDSDGDGLKDGEEVFPGNDGYVTNPKAYDSDGDGLNDLEEVIRIIDHELPHLMYASDPWEQDTDSDGLSDYLEVSDINGWITDPDNHDSDGDLLTDGEEVNGAGPPNQRQTSNPTLKDSDGDGLDDKEEVFPGRDGHITKVHEPDTDGDGLTDGKEYTGSGSESAFTSNPLKADTDGDGIDDYEEVFYHLDNYVTDPKSDDSDGDGLKDKEEISGSGTQGFTSDPRNVDTDEDGIDDYEEVFLGNDGYITDPSEEDTDKDTLLDKDEIDGNNDHQFSSDPTRQDTDNDGISDDLELKHPAGHILDPNNPDTDGDLLDDNLEVNKYRTNPNNPDTDGDLLDDNLEVNTYQTDPNKSDTDGDLLDDNLEVNTYQTDPNKSDTDGDLLSDAEEVNIHGTNPTKWDTDADGVNDKDQLTQVNQGFSYLLLLFSILSILVASILATLGYKNFIRPRLFATNEEYLESRSKVRDAALKQTLEDIKSSRDYKTTADKISQNVKRSASKVLDGDRFFKFTKQWQKGDIKATADSIAKELEAEKDGDALSFNFVGAFVPVSNELSSVISALAEDWWGFVPMEVMAKSAAPRFMYQEQHWSAHHLAPLLLRSVLAPRFANLTRIPEAGPDFRNIQHGYQFHTILAEYSKS